MILTGYLIQDNDDTTAATKSAAVTVPFEPFAIVKDVVIGKIGIDGLCVVYEGNCAVIRASVWKDADRQDDGEPSDTKKGAEEPSGHEHEEIALRDYQIAVLLRANEEIEKRVKDAVSSLKYTQLGDSEPNWMVASRSGKYLAVQDTVESVFPAKADTDKKGRLLVTCTVYPQYTGITFVDKFDADVLNLNASTGKLIGAMHL